MNVLIIGNADSIFVKTLIEKTHLPFDDKVSVLTGQNSIYKAFYRKNQVSVFCLKNTRTLFGIINFLNSIRVAIHQYDLIIVHYLTARRVLPARIGSIFSKKLLLVCWGSDILRQQNKNRIIENAIRASAAILISTQEIKEKFRVLYGTEYDYKIKRIYFGSNGIDNLKRNNYDQHSLSIKYGINEQKIVISIGYNKSVAQQHLKVLQIIGSLLPEERKKIHILLRLTYGDGDNEYINQIKKCVKQTGCTSSFFESYLTDEEVAELTFLTDVFIHAQITDSRSASMCEHLYSGSLVINPSWIKYSDLENKVFYLKFNSFSDLKKIVKDNLVKKENSQYRKLLYDNKETIYEICSWEFAIKLWRDIYLDNSMECSSVETGEFR